MSKIFGTLLLMLVVCLGTGCCWFDQCGYYNQCGACGPCASTYDPCTGLVNQSDPFAKCRARRIMKKLKGDQCDCHKSGCDCHHESSHHGGCPCHHDMTYSSGCPSCQSYGEPIYGEPIYGDSMETHYVPDSYPELMVPQEAKPMKPVPAPPAEPDELPMEGSSIPPTSYVVPAPLEGPSVPVLRPYHGR